MKPSVSVVMPVFNAEDTVKSAVNSILHQTLEDLQCLVINDGSIDNTINVLKQFSDPRLKVITIDHTGIVQALNTGLAAAEAPLIARMDADDTCHLERLALQKQYMDENPATGLVSCKVEYLGNQSTQRGYGLYVSWLNKNLKEPDIKRAMLIESPIAHPSVMFRKQLITSFGGYRSGHFPEDYELWLRWAMADVKMEKLTKTLVSWHDPPNRLSRTDSRYSPEAFFQVKIPYLLRTLRKGNKHYPRVNIWGAGKLARKKSRLLKKHGLVIDSFIDIDPKKIGNAIDGIRIISPISLQLPLTAPILSLVSSRGAREKVCHFLLNHGYHEGSDFFIA